VDDLTLSSRSARATTLSVTMINPTPGLSLDRVAFVPDGAVGSGRGDRPWPASNEIIGSLIRPFPATLTALPPQPADADLSSLIDWGLAVVVRAPVTLARVEVDGFRITYWDGSRVRSLRTRDKITIGTALHTCPLQ
jgi:hypothetical protein